MFDPDLSIETARLLLRAYVPADAEAFHAYQSLPEVARYLYWGPRDLEQVRASLAEKIERLALRDERQLIGRSVVLRATGELIGDYVLSWSSHEHRQGEIGYAFDPRHQGQGYATEAGLPMLAIGFGGLGMHRIMGRLDARNTASARVLERLGMRREAHLVENEFIKGEWTDELVYAMLRTEWEAREGR